MISWRYIGHISWYITLNCKNVTTGILSPNALKSICWEEKKPNKLICQNITVVFICLSSSYRHLKKMFLFSWSVYFFGEDFNWGPILKIYYGLQLVIWCLMFKLVTGFLWFQYCFDLCTFILKQNFFPTQ